MQQRTHRDRPDLVARHVEGTPALALGSSLGRTCLEDIAPHTERHVFVGCVGALARSLGTLEAIKSAPKAFGRLGCGGSPGRADGWQQLGPLGRAASHDGWGRAVIGRGLERRQAAAPGALRGGPQEPRAFVSPSPAGCARGPWFTEAAPGGTEGMKATEERLSVGQDAGNGRHLGVPALGDDALGGIPQGFALSQAACAGGGGGGGQQRPMERQPGDMIAGHKQLPPDTGERAPLFRDRHGAGETPPALLHGALPGALGQRAEPAPPRGLGEPATAPATLQTQTRIREDDGQPDRPRGACPERGQLRWRALPLAEGLRQDGHGRGGWSCQRLLRCPRGAT